MSSIYRKKRDQFFYYQTYQRNPATGKKDLKIYHSLGTKNKEEALLLKKKYDKKYEGQSNSLFILNQKYIKNSIFIFLIILLVTSTISYFQNHYFFQYSDLKPNRFENLDNQVIVDTTKTILMKETDPSNNSSNENYGKKIVDYPQSLDYKIVRKIELSSFKQCKMYITVDKQLDSDSIKLICDYLLKSSINYESVIISVYSNSKMGNDLAQGRLTNINSKEQKEAWLAVFSHNPVEGKYFNDNPSNYLSRF